MTKIILKTIKEFNEWKALNKKNINFVPTMGNLHEGHIALIRKAQTSKQNLTLLSIFVNPLQFEDKDDLQNYPKTIEKDIEIGFSSNADAIFIPNINEMFPNNGFKIEYLKASKYLSNKLCGKYRKGHFDGVCTVINRFLNIIQPQRIFLGEKDWQQLLIIKKMIRDKNFNVEIKSIDTERDQDGVPFSSRNNLLSKDNKKKLHSFSRELLNAKTIFNKTKKIDLNKIRKKLQDSNIKIEYLEHVNAFNLQKLTPNSNITMLAGAIKCSNIRLIDHVFLMKRNPIIAIDGPAGSGKSTVTKLLSRKLDFIYLDTGAMYRALSWYILYKKINYGNIEELNSFLKNISIKFQSVSNSIQDVIINEHKVTEKIRSPEVSNIVSSIASIGEVREFLVKEQRLIGNRGGIIAEGRDIGSKVFPDAELKIFLTASIDERARRRKIELENSGYGNIDLKNLKDQILKRDFNDSTREISPLIKAEDSIEIVSDGFDENEIVDKIFGFYLEKIPKELN